MNFVLLLCFIGHVSGQSLCPSGALYYNAQETCYWPSADSNDFDYHLDACAAKEGTVIRIPNLAVHDFLRQNIPWTSWFSSPYDIYIGLFEVFKSNNYYEIEMRAPSQTYLPWANSAQPAGPAWDQDCGIIDTGYKFQDKSCTEGYKAICSKEAASLSECPGSNPLFCDSTCYWPVTYSKKAETQVLNCLNYNGTLAVIHKSSTITKLKAKFSIWFGTSSLNVWVGYNDYLKEGDFRNTFHIRQQTYLPWATNEPSNQNNEFCVEMWHSNGNFNNILCSIARPTICEKHAPRDPTTTTAMSTSTTTTTQAPTTSTITQTTISKSTTKQFTTKLTPPSYTTDSITTSTEASTTSTEARTTSTEAGTTSTEASTTSSQTSAIPIVGASTISFYTTSNTTAEKGICKIEFPCAGNGSLNAKDIQARIRYLRELLRIPKNHTILYRRSKYSPYENRFKVLALGYTGVFVITAVVLIIIFIDILKVVQLHQEELEKNIENENSENTLENHDRPRGHTHDKNYKSHKKNRIADTPR